MDLRFIPDSGFMARGGGGPKKNAPHDWLVWHFTHVDNLPKIAERGCLLPANATEPVQNVANPGVKERRSWRSVDPDADYPEATVNDHVPFYIAAKSPMLYAVTRGHENYRGGRKPLVLLGAVLGDIVESGATWCVSDSNAAAAIANFSRDDAGIGTFVDFNLLCQRRWYNTPDDPDRKSRRAAELLVLDQVSLELVTVVIASDSKVLDQARAILETVGGSRQYHHEPEMFYE